MTKVGLKETLALLAAGYKKKDIEALAAIDDEVPAPAPDPEPAPAPAPAPEPTPAPDPEPNKELEQVKAQLDDTLQKLKESEEKVKKLQKENINKDSAQDIEKAKNEQAESLTKLFASFM